MTTASTTAKTVPAAPLRAPQAGVESRRGRKAAERFFVVPGEDEWEVWAGSDAASSHFVDTVSSPREVSAYHLTALALPIKEVVTMPIWLATIDRSLIPGMVSLQCEKRGILNRALHDSPFDYEIVAQENNESLIRAQTLPPTLSPDVCAETVEAFDLSVRFSSLPNQALIIWRELGGLCVALTRRHVLVYAATLGEEQLSESALSQLFRLLSIAQSERWLSGGTPEVVLRGTFTAEEENAVRGALGLQVRRESRPAPWPPTAPSKLVPESVQSALLQRRKAAKRMQQVSIVVGLYVAAVLIWSGYVGWLSYQSRTLAVKVNATAPQVQLLRSTALLWSRLQSAIDPAQYPVEILFRCANVLPKEGIQLTSFEQSGNSLILIGESKGTNSLRTATTLLSDLKASKELTEFTFKMPQPKVLDNACKFRIEGTRAPSHP